MEVFIINEDTHKVVTESYECIANLEQFYNDMYDVNGENWFESIEDAEEALLDLINEKEN